MEAREPELKRSPQPDRDPELQKELAATVHARKELGPEYEAELIDSFLEKVEERLSSGVERRIRRQLAEQQVVVARGTRPSAARQGGGGGFGERFGFGAVSLVLAIPLSAIASQQDLPGLLIAWTGIVGVNAVHAAHSLRGRPWRRGARTGRDDWRD